MADKPDFTQFELPCTDPERMNDWHISERAPLAPEDEEDVRILARMQVRMDDPRATEEKELKAADRAVNEAVTELRARRRQAIASCYYDCPMQARRMCLAEGLKPLNLDHGIWGGYPESERRDVVAAIRRREKGMTGAKAADVIISEEKKRALNGV